MALTVSQGLADAVRSIAKKAGDEILDVYRSVDIAATQKKDNSPLTQADLRAHRVIVAALSALTPDIPVFSEEAADIPYSVRSTWQRYWLVDPLDGTKEFISRNGEFTVNIALIENGVPTLGVVHVPVRDVTYWGTAQSGAWRVNADGRAERIQVRASVGSPVRVVGSKSHGGDSLNAFLSRLGPHELLPVGSSLKFCMVAEGAADVYPRLGPTSEWDTAAAQAVVTAAGGHVVTTDGSPLTYNAKEDILNPHFIVYGDRSTDWPGLVSGTAAKQGI